jgi:hypothetical protein
VYDDVREKLAGHGIPVAEIAFIQDYDDDAAKAGLFKAVREGKIRVLFGSTAKMGEGAGVLGYADKADDLNNGIIYVLSFPTESSISTMPGHCPSHTWAIAHEIGHYVGKLSHSTDATIGTVNPKPNPNHLEGTDNELRLMDGERAPKMATSPRMLIKIEWDMLHAFFE